MDFEKIKDQKVLLILIIGIAIFLRIINIVSEQVWADEAISIFIAKSSYNEFWKFVIKDVHPPLYYLILKGWVSIFGSSILSCRLLSVIFSILTLPVLYLIGKEIKDEKLGLIIIFLFSFSPFSIYYANEIRSYSLIHLTFTLGIYFTIKSLKNPGLFKNYLIIAFIGIIFVYTHYIGFVYMSLIYLSLLIFNKGEKNLIKYLVSSIVIIIFSYILWLPFAYEDLVNGASGYAGGRLNLINFFYYAFCYFLGPVPSDISNPYILTIVYITFLINIPLIIISLISLIGFFYFYIHKKKEGNDSMNIIHFLIMSIILLFGITIITGILIENTFTAKNLIGGLSIIYIIEGIGLYYLFINGSFTYQGLNHPFSKLFDAKFYQKLKVPLIIIILIVNLVGYPIFRAYYLQKPDWEGCVKKLKNKIKKDDIIICAFPGGRAPFPMEYYSDIYGLDLKKYFYEISYEDEDIEEFFEDISEENITRIWIVNFWEKNRDPNDKTEELLVDEYNLEKIDDYEFRLDITLTLYEI